MGVVSLGPSAGIQRCIGFVRNISNFHMYTASDFARWKGDQPRCHRQFWESFNAFRRLQNCSGGTLRGMDNTLVITVWNTPTVTGCLHRTFTQFSWSRTAKFYLRDRALYAPRRGRCLHLSKDVFPVLLRTRIFVAVSYTGSHLPKPWFHLLHYIDKFTNVS